MAETGTAHGHHAGAEHGHAAKHHDGGLLMIGLFKLVEAVFFFLVGVGAIHFIHRDLGDAAWRLADPAAHGSRWPPGFVGDGPPR